MRIISLVIPLCLLLITEAKRADLRPRITEPQVYYEEDDSQAAEDDYSPAVYQPRTRALPSPRSKDALHSSKPPPVQTIRNYNKVNDDGSFTFGYEAADGSFKEETRGTDCVVRGKYGYIDPDGNKREFTYVSGNPCDPNAPKEDEDDLADKQEEDDISGPANYPSVRPIPRPAARPAYQHPTTPRPPTTIFQTQYQLDDDASQELGDEDFVKPSTQLRGSGYRTAQQPTAYVPVTPSTALYEPSPTANPAALYRLASSTTQYQSTASPVLRGHPAASIPAADPIYQSELVYDPATGQYNTQLYQSLPQTVGDFTLSHKLQPFVAQPQSYLGLQQLQQIQPQQPQRQSPLYKQPAAPQPSATVNQPQEVLYRKQQAQLLQQSQQLYAQQQRRQQQQQSTPSHRLQLLESQTQPQSFYYVAPARSSNSASAPLSVGQIDHYLRATAGRY
ncbi:LOW QUALITY PROTEIN: RNA polymerase II degradation factor 1-like [Apis dorsata]|uniref:LOW QUALITY PROTEIN: RNA polymerase II degradation factor 1-like n=1 Tax=Apis dorsata TaxID=7462 RepID=UPI001293BD8F|nr:LOW QUALITY PROTEIN: RNA polymerase II degradation factor 1-like [Apis dorsata]